MTNEECKSRAQALLADMSVEEKVAQIAGIMYIEGMYDRMLPFLQNGMGEISCLCVRDMKTIEEVAAWQRKVLFL